MTKVSEIFDYIVTAVEEVLPGYTHMPESVLVDENDGLSLENGFVVGIGGGAVNATQYCDDQILERTYFVTITNDYSLRTDTDLRNNSEKNIMEDMFTVTKRLYGDPSLNGLVCDIEFTDDTGPTYLDETKQFLVVTASFLIKYQETIGAN